MPSEFHGRRARSAVERGIRDGLPEALDSILTASNALVPDASGELQASGGTDTDGTRGTVFYDVIYAPIQHERTDLTHDDGQAKFLEVGAARARPEVAAAIASGLRRYL